MTLPLVLLLGIASAQTDPCSLTATHTIANGQTVNISDWYPSVSSASGEVIDIGVGATLIINKSFTFVVCKIRCADAAAIVTQASTSTPVVFGALGTIMLSCNNTTMWNGITVSPGTSINFNNNYLYDAHSAITFPLDYHDTNNRLVKTQFINNTIGILIGGFSNSLTSDVGFSSCYGNKFSETHVVNVPYTTNVNDSHVIAGIYVTHGNVIFGTNGARNVFENMLSGIKLRLVSTALISNCDFKGMFKPSVNNPNYSTSGNGIYLSTSRINVTRISSKNCRFQDNEDSGINSSNHSGEIKVEYATFSGHQLYGIYIDHSGLPSPITIQNNFFTLDGNECRSAIFCTRPSGNSSINDSYIRRNRILLPLRDTGSSQVGALIDIRGIQGSAGINKFEVSSNTIISLDWHSKEKHGIWVTGTGNNYVIQHNNISYRGISAVPAGENYNNLGIVFDQMSGTGNIIFQNKLRSILNDQTLPFYNDRSLLKCPIHISRANAPIICDNDVDSTYRGFHFGELNLGTIFGLNKMKTHVHALYFGNNIVPAPSPNIGPQDYRANTWSIESADYLDFGAVYYGFSSTGLPPVKFRYNPSSGIIGQIPLSASPALTDWFIPGNGSSTDTLCNRDITRKFEDSEIEIAEGEYPYDTPVQDWDLQFHLWSKILRNPGIEKDVKAVVDFMGDPKENPTSAHLYAEALYNFEKAFYPDSIWQVKWDATLSNISANEIWTTGILNNLGLDTLNVDPEYADKLGEAWSQMALYQDTLRMLADTFTIRKDTKLADLISDFGALPSDYDWEKAWVNILEKAIQCGQGIELDSTSRADLLSVANSCPLDVGVAVQAVLAYMPVVDAYQFRGCENRLDACVEERQDKNSLPESPAILYPNPTSSYLTVLLKEAGLGGMWKIMSVSGKLIAEGMWNPEESLLHINVANYNSGLYLFHIETALGQRSTMKFSIVK